MTQNRTLARMAPAVLLVLTMGLSAQAAGVAGLRCNNLVDPSGVDDAQPRLSWLLESNARGERQTAYEVIAASLPDTLASGRGDLWDSGKVISDQSIEVPYGGATLASAARIYWKVRVWNQDDAASDWSAAAQWTMGLLHPSDWTAQWIGHDEFPETNWMDNASWIWTAETNGGTNGAFFRRTLGLPIGREIARAHIDYAGSGEVHCAINGDEVSSSRSHREARETDVTFQLHGGSNVITLATAAPKKGGAAGVIARLEIQFRDGQKWIVGTDARWKASRQEDRLWREAWFKDGEWAAAKELGPAGAEPWGPVRVPEAHTLPARWMRKEFRVDKEIKRAMVFYSGLGWSELYINGRRVGDEALSPGLTDYSKRVFYLTHDVTEDLRRGSNAIGAVLGGGFFYGPRSSLSVGMRTFGCPKLLLQLRLEYEDGSVENVATDPTWKWTDDGPITADNVYDGETYDARKEMRGWDETKFDDFHWSPAEAVAAPEGALRGQPIYPVRVTATLAPASIREKGPGDYIVDMGQNMVGWCRLHVEGPAGTRVTLRHAERLRPNGELYQANLRSAEAEDVYILKGRGEESWEPRFTYHGFRFVEVLGLPGELRPGDIEGRVVNDDLPSAGDFSCSDPMLCQIYSNVLWGVRGNYHSIPTDCPQRDERQGWLGDRAEESAGETYLFDTEPLYRKWSMDMADAQRDDGAVPDVCPAFWQVRNDDVTWPSASVFIPNMLRRQFGDDAAARHYESGARWIEHMRGYVTNGLIARDSYGDWCMPPEDKTLIHSKDPARITNPELLATAYFIHDLTLMEGDAALLGKMDDAERFGQWADDMKEAFNQRFLKRDSGQYDNGTQTSCVIPLAFGLVPDDMRERVFHHLIDKITGESSNHIGVGLIGGQFVNQVLSGNGRADLAYAVDTQPDYPSLGYMAARGATTVWELWNGDTADPAMNSGNHVMLIGDLVVWLYEDLAGIAPDAPGFKQIVMKPQPVDGLDWVDASHLSPYGWIRSHWQKNGARFDWRVEIPPNTTATIYLPAISVDNVTESGRPIDAANDIGFFRMEEGRAVFHLGPGAYHFVSRNVRFPRLATAGQ